LNSFFAFFTKNIYKLIYKKKMMQAPRKDSKNGWSVSQFETYRPRLTNFLNTSVRPLLDSKECRRILIEAPVKSGKREMVEYLAMRDEAHNPTRVHAFISAFHRVADESQREELEKHNLKIFSLTKKTDVDKCLAWIHSNNQKDIALHIDECDFGSGTRQMLSRIYRNTHNNENITIIMFSATPQEVLFSGEIDTPNEEDSDYQEMIDEIIHTGERIIYTPPENFCGPNRFLEAGLITEAIPFFYKTGATLSLSEQGRSIMTDLRAECATGSGRNIIILRLSYSDIGLARSGSVKNNKAIHQFLNGRHTIPELHDCLIYADKEEKSMPDVDGILLEKFQWSKQLFWEGKRVDRPIIVVIDQTCSRSTELACHNRLFALHDFRNKVTFSTSSQALERVNHYDTRYGGFQPIRVYGHKKTFELSARRINYETYLNTEWECKKLDVRRGLGEACYVIRRPIGEHEIHPSYPDPMTEEECNRALQAIGCFAQVTISPRVRGNIYPVRVYDCVFEPCTKDSFPALKTVLDQKFDHTFNNPFTRSEVQGLDNGQYKGQLRGWSVLDFETQVKTQPGWGVTTNTPRLTICYHGGVLGVAIRSDTGITVEQDTLNTFKSMYKK
jgi:hypothetical protein